MNLMNLYYFINLTFTGVTLVYSIARLELLPNIVIGSLALTDRQLLNVMTVLLWTVYFSIGSIIDSMNGKITYHLLFFVLFAVLLMVSLLFSYSKRGE